MKKSKLFIASIVCFALGAIGLFSLPTDFSTDLLGGTFIVIVAGVVLLLIDRKNRNSKNNAKYTPQFQSFNYRQNDNQQNTNQPFQNQQIKAPVQKQTQNKPNVAYNRTITTMDRDVDIPKEPGEYSQEREFTVVGVTYEGRQQNLAMLSDTKITDAEIEWTPFNDELGIKVYFEGLEMGWVSRKNLPFFKEYEDKIRYISNAFVGMNQSGEYYARFRVRYYAPKDCT